jgi:competence protein ComEA
VSSPSSLPGVDPGAPSRGALDASPHERWPDRPVSGAVGAHLGELADRLGTSVASLVIGATATVLIGGVAWFAATGGDVPAAELTIPYASTSTTEAPGQEVAAAPPVPTEVLVHAAGSVRHPGVYAMGSDARVSDLVAAAGGPLPDADLDRVNLAAPLVDGSRVYVPSVGQEELPPVVAGGVAVGPSGAGVESVDPGQTINLNTATATELERLPGVGPATAAAIVEHRDRNGAFSSVDDLIEVRGIGDAKLAALRDLVHV